MDDSLCYGPTESRDHSLVFLANSSVVHCSSQGMLPEQAFPHIGSQPPCTGRRWNHPSEASKMRRFKAKPDKRTGLTADYELPTHLSTSWGRANPTLSQPPHLYMTLVVVAC